LADGRRGLDRGRDPSRDPLLSERMIQLFHSGPVAPRVHGGRRLVPLHSSPNIFLVRAARLTQPALASEASPAREAV
jgi:hypothetical protein